MTIWHFLRRKRYHLPLLLVAAAARYAAANHTAFPEQAASDHYNPETGEFFNTPATRPVKDGTGAAVWQMVSQPEKFRPAGRLPSQTVNWQAFLAPSEQAKFVWFGHSTLMMRINGKTVLIDPVYANTMSPLGMMMYRFQPPPAALEELPPIDFVVYSHAHYDHLDKDVVLYLAQHQPNIQYITPLGLGAYLREWGVAAAQIRELDWWQSAAVANLEFHAVPARHDSARTPFDGKKSLWAGWVFRTPHEQIYFSGDSSYSPNFVEIGKRFDGFDIAFVENGQYNELWEDNHMFPNQTVQAVLDVKVKRWVPIHWGAYPLSLHAWDEPVLRSSALSAQYRLPMLTPIMGQIFTQETTTEKWWETVK